MISISRVLRLTSHAFLRFICRLATTKRRWRPEITYLRSTRRACERDRSYFFRQRGPESTYLTPRVFFSDRNVALILECTLYPAIRRKGGKNDCVICRSYGKLPKAMATLQTLSFPSLFAPRGPVTTCNTIIKPVWT